MPEKNCSQKNRSASSPIEANTQKSFPFYVWSGLLTPQHRKRMGISVWVYLWCLRRITYEKDGLGFVLGGSRIKVERIAKELGMVERSIKSDLARLRKHEYLQIKRIPYGLIITVSRSKRGLGRKRSAETCLSENSEKCRNLPISSERSAETCTAEVQDPALIKEEAVGVSSKRRGSSGSASPHRRSAPAPNRESSKSKSSFSEVIYA